MPVKTPVEERFWKYVEKTDSCWNWVGSLDGKGYGQINVGGKPKRSHRIAYELIRGPIPKGLVLCHTCDNKRCVNPDHLFLGTQRDNIQDALKKGLFQPVIAASRKRGGELNAHSKLTLEQAKFIKEACKLRTYTQAALAEMFGVSKSAVSLISTGRNWKLLDGPTDD